MANENNIQLPPDSTGQRFRLYAIEEISADGSTVIEVNQEVVTLADGLGNLFQLVSGGSIKTSDPTLEELMRAIIIRLDILNVHVSPDYNPPDEFGLN